MKETGVLKTAFPFTLEQGLMERLVVISIHGESGFEEIEPQVFDDPVNGKGMRIIMYRKDKKIDVYWQPGVYVTRESISIGAGIGMFEETVIEPARFEITPRGIDLDIGFVDAYGRLVKLGIRENDKARHPFPFLAPVGKNVVNPVCLFLVHMTEFDFVKKKGTSFFCKIGEHIHHPAGIPLLRNGKRILLIRYCDHPVIAVLNPPRAHPVCFEPGILSGNVETDGMVFHVASDHRLTSIRLSRNPEAVELTFPEGFPTLYDVPDNSVLDGPWKIHINSMHITGGTYTLSRSGSTVVCTLAVQTRWKPVAIPFSCNLFIRLVSFFRTWPTTYRWKALIDLEKNTMEGHWERV